ncbi:hypothetical protein R5H32_11375 [Defluviimonas sp. D31]|uniref:hypothetical protein n=1 Tax=Defluviimonas sp. D31 TaxID=3083253 RepID=UPI00296E2A77|nr:hypothetical protein [Defluviimonas sp. D31]MDW4549955.1 hypothetical protein [Defluviimonas sp. D31]
MSQAKRRDEIDLIVDDILAKPERAEELKRLLRDRLGAPAEIRQSRLRVVVSNDDPDSLWDNMPI